MANREERVWAKAEAYLKDKPDQRPLVEELAREILSMTDEQCIMVAKILKQDKRANALGLRLDIDTSTNTFFLADVATNTVVAPPPMNLATVTAWLDDYEREAAEE